MVDGYPVFGWCDQDERRVCISEGLTNIDRVKTIIHEICHAYSEDLSEAAICGIEEAAALALLACGHTMKRERDDAQVDDNQH